MKRLILIIAILLFAVPGLCTTYHYVDPNLGTGGNDGSSWANAWRTFAGISWGTLQTEAASQPVYLYVKKGSTSTAIMEIGGSGSSDTNRIIITTDSGDSGVNPIITNSSGHGIRHDSRSYLTISNMQGINNSSQAITASDGGNIGSGIIIEDCTISGNGTNGLFFKGNDITIRRNTVINNGGSCPSHGWCHGIYVDTGSTSYIYENTVYSTPNGTGIQVKDDTTIYRNLVYSNHHDGIGLNDSNGATDMVAYVYHNVAYDNGDAGIRFYGQTNSTTGYIYSNSLYKNGTSVPGGSWCGEIAIQNNQTLIELKNNLFYAATGGTTITLATSQSNLTSDYNIHYSNIDPIYPGTWANWTTTLGHDGNGDNVDPLYTSPASDMTLQSTSPAIDAGVDLGVSYDDALNPNSTWPDSVTTLDQDSYGSGWEIGAYASAPTALPVITGIQIGKND